MQQIYNYFTNQASKIIFMTKDDLNKLRDKLPINGIRTIAEKTGFTISYVNMVLAGNKNNLIILESAIQVAISHRNELNRIKETIDSL